MQAGAESISGQLLVSALTVEAAPDDTTKTTESVPGGIEAQICAGQWAEAEALLQGRSDSRERAFQLVAIDVLRLTLTGDHSLIPGCNKRCSRLQDIAAKDAAEAHKALNAEAEDPRSLLQRVTLQSKFSHPWCEASARVAALDDNSAAKQKLKEWRDSVGLLSFAELVKGALIFLDRPLSLVKVTKAVLAIRTSWNHCRRAQGRGRDGDGDGSEGGGGGNSEAGRRCEREDAAAVLVEGIFLLMLTKIPTHFRTVLKGIGFQADAEKALVLLDSVKKSDRVVCKMFAGTLRVLHFLLKSQQEYDSENVKCMAMATSEVESIVKEHPTWVLPLWLKSHVYRRQGRIKEAITLLNKAAEIVKDQTTKEGPMFSSYRLEFDHGFLLFTIREFQKSSSMIKPLVEPGSLFGAKVLAITVLASSCAFDTDTDDNGRKQRSIAQLDELSTTEPTRWGNIDKSIMKKYPTLQARNNKQLLYYEILYLFGHMKAYNPEMASKKEVAVAWLDEKLKALEKISSQLPIGTDALATLELTEENRAQVEERCTTLLLLGAVLGIKSSHVKAQELLQKLVDSCEKNEKIAEACEDSYFVGYAYYELGSICLKRKDLPSAKKYLHDASKLAKHGRSSFEHMLQYKCTGKRFGYSFVVLTSTGAGAIRALKQEEKRVKGMTKRASG